jgi:hypothetical protein
LDSDIFGEGRVHSVYQHALDAACHGVHYTEPQ